jgi:ceramide glucosyltransferase
MSLILVIPFGFLSVISCLLLVWQWLLAMRFPLNQRLENTTFTPGVTLLKPLKGMDSQTADCLRSWLAQEYSGPVQVLFGVADEADPVCALVRDLIKAHPKLDAQLFICREALGANAKVSTLVQLERLAKNEILIVSDADVWVPPDFLGQIVAPLENAETGLVNCFYRLANPANLAMRWEAFLVNAEFWSQVLQAKALKPLDFALGAVMATSRKHLNAAGGFSALLDYLADDYQLGNRIARAGGSIELCATIVQCRQAPATWRNVWSHQIRWSRTIRFCQGAPYFMSIISNVTLWAALFLLSQPAKIWPLATGVIVLRSVLGFSMERKMNGRSSLNSFWLGPVSDLLKALIWLLSFLGNKVVWRGKQFRVMKGGKMAQVNETAPKNIFRP